MSKTKIVCTIGPASESVKVLEVMVKNGMDIARLNFSHGSYENHQLLVNNIRSVSKRQKKKILIMQDLQGPKIRVAELSKSVEAIYGQQLVIGRDFNLDFDISKSVKHGERILIEDGLIELFIEKVEGRQIFCNVITGGKIQSHKGINLPMSRVKFAILTEKDICDLKFGLTLGLDFVAVSFVRNRKDILNIKKLISENLSKGFAEPKVIAKIEKPEAVKNFDSILKVVDWIMVARGDLGVEMSDFEVPIIQKTIVLKCLKVKKPVIVATQMLDSMIRNPRPTRAEVSDVANAVLDGATCVMLSGESAFGKYPVEAVLHMNQIINYTENSKIYQQLRK